MQYRDYYQVLGVEYNAKPGEIKAAFRSLAKKYHPDHNPGSKMAENQFKEINEAYAVLCDSEKRALYDKLSDSYRHWDQNGHKGKFNWKDWTVHDRPAGTSKSEIGTTVKPNGASSGSGNSDFFNLIFGTAGQEKRDKTSARRQKNALPVYEHPVRISLDEAYHGTERTLQVEGRMLRVKIPPGAKTGTRVRMENAGPTGPNGQKIDLYLSVEVEPDVRFERIDTDLYTQVEITVFTAILGGQVDVPTLDGSVLLTIPAGTQPNQTFRLIGKGMPTLNNTQTVGNLYAQVKVQIPRQITAKQRALFEALQKFEMEKVI